MEEERGEGVTVAFEAPPTRDDETDGGVKVAGGSTARGTVGCSARLQGRSSAQSV
jgi:hypothetical protein